jgi:hypothetical protein
MSTRPIDYQKTAETILRGLRKRSSAPDYAGAAERLRQAQQAAPFQPAERAAETGFVTLSPGELSPLGTLPALGKRGVEPHRWAVGPVRLGLADTELELVPEDGLGEDDSTRPTPGIWVADGARYVPCRRWPLGTFASRVAKTERRQAPGRFMPVDDLAAIALLAGPWRSWGRGRPVPPTAENVLAALEALGVRVLLGPDDRLLLLTSTGRAPDARTADAITRAGPLLRARLRSEQARCAWPGHQKGEAPEATTVSGGLPICSCANHAIEPAKAGAIEWLKAAVKAATS